MLAGPAGFSEVYTGDRSRVWQRPRQSSCHHVGATPSPPLPFGTTWSAVGFAVRTTAGVSDRAAHREGASRRASYRM